jgi:hypothetical protein
MSNAAIVPLFTGPRPDLAPFGRMNRPTRAAYATEVVRRMSVRPASIERRIADGTFWPQSAARPLGRLGSLVMERPLVPADCSGVPGWRGSGRLVGSRWPGRGFGRVDVEVIPWSSTATGLRLARRSPLPSYWSTRRVGRYWTLAHAAADWLARQGSGSAAEEAGQLVGFGR